MEGAEAVVPHHPEFSEVRLGVFEALAVVPAVKLRDAWSMRPPAPRQGAPVLTSVTGRLESASQSRIAVWSYRAAGVACVRRAVEVDLPRSALYSRMVFSFLAPISAALHSPRAVVWSTDSMPSRAL